MFRSVLFASLLWLLVSCTPPAGDDYVRLPVDIQQLRNAVTLGPGDVFDVRVYGEKDLSGIYRVSAEGTIHFPLVGEVRVQNLSPSEVATLLQDRLRDGYLREPFVTVTIKEYNSKKIFVLGQVAKPGTFPFEGEMNIVQAVTLAGGFTPMARKNNVIVTRVDKGEEKRIQVPVESISEGLAPNLPLRPGDIVYVPETVL
ncbi:MAG: polysaccharide export protein [Deltaproteobacteria bacterium]|nr:polysaccharide export protein [Deltaproteobacteria bacterium]